MTPDQAIHNARVVADKLGDIPDILDMLHYAEILNAEVLALREVVNNLNIRGVPKQ